MNSLPLFDSVAAVPPCDNGAAVVPEEHRKQPRPQDPTAGKHGGNAKSVAAFDRIAPRVANDQERVRVFVAGCGWNGATLKEVAKAFDKFPHQISGRFTTLKSKHVIFDSGREREGCAVYVSEERWSKR